MYKKIHKTKSNKIFLTGGTGLIGSYLLKLLLQNNNKVYVLVRNSKDQNSKKRISNLLKFWNKKSLNYALENLVILNGDITRKNLGLNRKTIGILENEVEEIYHCAAATKFNLTLDELKKVNVNGLINLLDLCFNFSKKGILKKINYLSTIYICGDYEGIFTEESLDVGQKFCTPYEKSKFEAEKVVNNFRKRGLCIDVFRPPIVIGESGSGKTIAFNQAFYQGLSLLSSGILKSIPCLGINLNLVFLDELCRSILCISSNTKQNNKNYHVFSSKRLSAKRFLNFFYSYLKIRKPNYVRPESLIENGISPLEKMILKYNFLFLDRKTQLDSKLTNKLLRKFGFTYSPYCEEAYSKILNYAIKEKIIRKYNYD